MEDKESIVKKWILPAITIATLIALTILFQSASPLTTTSRKVVWNGNTYHVVKVSDAKNIVMGWKDSSGKPLKTLNNFIANQKNKGNNLVCAMNGGMYMTDFSPLGLYFEDGVKRQNLNIKSGSGNFYLKPNGVFAINSDGSAYVTTTTDFMLKSKLPKYATQSGPMLVINNSLHSKLTKGSKNVHIRNAVGVTAKGEVYFVISDTKTNFFDLATLFKDHLNCSNALYLDGFVSRMVDDNIGRNEDGNFGVMIGVKK